jgi:hypothetical protein
MLGVEVLDVGRAGAPRQLIERGVAFAEGDGMFFGNVRKQFAEAPYSALVEGIA